MQIRLLDILADPDDNRCWPLKLHTLTKEEKVREKIPYPHKSTGLYCKFYCYRKGKYLVKDPLSDDERTLPKEELDEIVTLDECKVCVTLEVIDGILYHDFHEKRKWFIVSDGIAVMHGIENRSKKFEEKFFEKYPDVWEELELEWY